jgi:hypothetical protein
MSTFKLPPANPNRPSLRQHKTELRWQILFPVLFISILVFATAGLLIYAAVVGGDATKWGATATVWLLVPVLLFALILFGVLVALAGMMRRMLKSTPKYTGQAQSASLYVTAETKKFLDTLTEPVLTARTWIETFAKFVGAKEQK